MRLEVDAIMPGVRMTVTLDPDLAARLRAVARERGISLEEALNSTLRRGLISDERGSTQPYQLASRRLNQRAGVDLEQALSLAAELEDVEAIRRLHM